MSENPEKLYVPISIDGQGETNITPKLRLWGVYNKMNGNIDVIFCLKVFIHNYNQYRSHWEIITRVLTVSVTAFLIKKI